jgi:U3 small nucleolar RNA-associated protein 11
MSMKNLLKTRTYRERAQPAARQHLGLLEKHKDYVQRARDFHKKEDAIKKLKEKAAFRNPDEYYFKMAHTSTEDGVHKKAAAEQPTNDEMRKFKKEDASYLMVKQTAEAKKIERLRASLHMLDAPLQNKHTIFVSDEEKGRAFEVKGHGRTPAEAASAPPVQQPNKKTGKKRMREAEERAAAEAAAVAALDDEEDDDDEEEEQEEAGASSSAAAPAALPRNALEKLEKERAKKYSELEQREERHKKMGQALQRIGIQKALQGKGPVMKMKGKGDNGGKVFKWKQRRKK